MIWTFLVCVDQCHQVEYETPSSNNCEWFHRIEIALQLRKYKVRCEDIKLSNNLSKTECMFVDNCDILYIEYVCLWQRTKIDNGPAP